MLHRGRMLFQNKLFRLAYRKQAQHTNDIDSEKDYSDDYSKDNNDDLYKEHYDGFGQSLGDSMVMCRPLIYNQKRLLTSKYGHMQFESFDELYTHVALNNKEDICHVDNTGTKYKMIPVQDKMFGWIKIKC